MKTKQILTLYRKEWLGVMRDRKSIVMLVLTALVMYPVIFGVIGLIAKSETEKQEASVSRVVITEQAAAGAGFAEMLTASGQVEVVEADDPAAALEAREVDAVLRIAEGTEGNLQVAVNYDERYSSSKTALERLQTTAEAYKGQEIGRRLQDLGVSTTVLEPIAVTEQNIASTDEGASMFTNFLPYILAIGLIAGSMNLGVEITAGEKERGTITTLLVSQLSRAEVALGKLLTTVTMAIISVLLNLLSLVIGLALMTSMMGEDVPAGMFNIGSATTVLQLLLILLPFGCMVSGIIIFLGTFARNSKEGNVYVMPLMFLAMGLGLASGSMDASVSLGMYAVPIMGPLLSIKQVLLNTGNTAGLIVAVLTSIVYTVLVIAAAVKLYEREEVMFRM